MSISKLFLCGAVALFLAGNAVSQVNGGHHVVGPEVFGSLTTILNDYWDGKVSVEELSQYVDRALAKENDPNAKAKILSEVIPLPEEGAPNHDVDCADIRYSQILADISNEPDVVARAFMQNASAKHREVWNAAGGDQTMKMLPVLESEIAAAKVICENLQEPKMVTAPSVNGFCYTGPGDSPELAALVGMHDVEEAIRTYVVRQNNMTELWKVLDPEMTSMRKELNITDEGFARMWMQVKTRKFSPSPGAWRVDRH